MMTRKSPQGCGKVVACFAVALQLLLGSGHFLLAQEAEWIWSPEHERNSVPQSTCHFRKNLQLQDPREAKVTIAADDQFELRINGRLIGTGSGFKKLIEYDVSKFLVRGKNVIAVKATNTRGNTAAMAARVIIKDQDGQWRSYSSDKYWKTSLRPLPLWDTAIYNDGR